MTSNLIITRKVLESNFIDSDLIDYIVTTYPDGVSYRNLLMDLCDIVATNVSTLKRVFRIALIWFICNNDKNSSSVITDTSFCL